MKPEEIAPHVGKGDRLVTVECDEIRHSIKPGWYSAVVGGWSVFTGAPSAFHSIRPVGEACEWRDENGYGMWISGCGRPLHFDNPYTTPIKREFRGCPFCLKPIKEVGGGDDGQEGGER